ncbi:MAG: leucyl aminopeptidase [Hyphomicrobiaceae bacterium]|nr:leucyl aminopeptidase [Hyphomicrobiaceae bacterium]
MSKTTAVSFTDIAPLKEGVAVILAEDGPTLSPAGKALDKASEGALTNAIKMRKFKGKKKSILDMIMPGNLGLSRVLIVGVGALKDFSEDDWVRLGGAIRGKLTGRDGPNATIVLERPKRPYAVSAEQAADVALGAMLRSYKFDKYKTKQAKKDGERDNNDTDLAKLTIQCANASTARRRFATQKAVGEGINVARDLVNEPANILGPKEFADRAKALTKLGVKVQVLDEQAMRKQGMDALLAVGQGSDRPSFMAVMEWKGAKDKSGKPVAIVGKGVTFDTGGISIKPAAGMGDMKGDMAGAACVVGLIHALAARKAKVNAVGLIGLVENMPSGTATRPGDVVGSMSGQTIEILNTDAEGRLVLADVLCYAQEKYKPKWVVNLATLTGAILVALGNEHAGLFSNDDKLSDKLTKAGIETGEKVWRLPLGPKYDELIKSDIADMKNIGGRWGGSITAAQFLQRFIKEGTPWAHLDIAGTGMGSPKTEINQSWGSGFGVRLLNRLVAENDEG